MTFSDYLQFESPEFVALVIGLIVFIFVFSVLRERLEKGVNVVIALSFGIISGWYLFRSGLVYNTELGLLFFVLAIAVIFIIVRAFVRFSRNRIG